MLEWVSALGQLLLGIATLVLAMAGYQYTRKSVALEALRNVRDSWLQVDAAVLGDDRNLRIAESIDANAQPADLEAARKRWLVMMMLNPVVSDYMAARNHLLPNADEVVAGCRATLAQWLRDDDVFALTQAGGYFASFAQFCREIKAALPKP